ncbi:hypothetical protein C8J56DRAFT_709185, partial [Mycena floridula]
CSDCQYALRHSTVPRFALANDLYRGSLPAEFDDREMICAKYRTTAQVTRLFRSSNPRNQRVMTGNTCAH